MHFPPVFFLYKVLCGFQWKRTAIACKLLCWISTMIWEYWPPVNVPNSQYCTQMSLSFISTSIYFTTGILIFFSLSVSETSGFDIFVPQISIISNVNTILKSSFLLSKWGLNSVENRRALTSVAHLICLFPHHPPHDLSTVTHSLS